MKRITDYGAVLLGLLCISITLPTAALVTDKQQPIQVAADKAERDEKIGITVYDGNVKITQGSILIEADNVTIKTIPAYGNQPEALDELITSGGPAHFQQQIDVGGSMVDAIANTIQYKVADKMVHLIDNATLKRQGNVITGDRISYDIKAQRVQARGEDSINKPADRVKVTITPAKKPKADKPATTP